MHALVTTWYALSQKMACKIGSVDPLPTSLVEECSRMKGRRTHDSRSASARNADVAGNTSAI